MIVHRTTAERFGPVDNAIKLIKYLLSLAEFHADFKSVEIIEKVHPEKNFCQKLLQVSSIEEDKLQFCTNFFA
jgi:hypothetical protein